MNPLYDLTRRRLTSTTDASGGRARGTPVDVTITGRVDARGAVDQSTAGGGVEEPSRWFLYADGDADVTAADQIVDGDDVFEVVGRPWRARDGDGSVHHVEANLRLA